MSVAPGKLSYRDRTQEFLSVAERLKKSFSSANNAATSSSSSNSAKHDATRSAVAIQSEFNKRASKIGFGIHQTSQKLAKLAKLAKRTSMFDDPTTEIQELTAVIKQDITALNAAVVDLQFLCNSQNESGNISSDTSTHSTTVVDNLKNRLMSATKEFKEVLTMRTENLKVHENRRQLFSSTASKDSTNPFVRQRPLASRSAANASPAPPPWANGSASSSQLFPSKQTDVESQPLLQQQQQQAAATATATADGSTTRQYMQSRAEALHNVESTIHELSNIFTQLATMVSQQGELAIRIDENMDETLSNVEGAQGQLGCWRSGLASFFGRCFVTHAELAIYEVMKLAWDRGCRKLVVEGDNVKVIAILQGRGGVPVNCQLLAESIRSYGLKIGRLLRVMFTGKRIAEWIGWPTRQSSANWDDISFVSTS
ncbi:hypothetical protein GH714_033657 [Hevea brasiliensis]|uniref:t-SNARE coiled-coil homology domain-containing protein n=1 Tax=Hevea brasiliensis TaxID=3981 RepID=A0A6A6LSZ4_HEVBR|nr:hypothetical protein GH714_033657 [Hevea brasiliensis]